MGGLFTITVQEARGFVASQVALDKLAIVMGFSSAGGSGVLSSFFLSGAAAVTACGYGDAVDTLCQIIEQPTSDGSTAAKVPAALYSMVSSTVGSYGTIDVTGVTGSSVVTTHTATKPYITAEARIKVTLGGTIGVTGITLQYSLDAGRTYSNTVALGTANTYTIPNSNIQFDFAAGTLVTGDIVKCRTHAPAPSTADIDAAFTALAASNVDMGILVLDFDCTAALAAHVTTGLNVLKAVGKRCVAIVRTRLPNFDTPESEATWLASVASDYASFSDSRICVRAGYGLITDAMTTRQYLRSTLAQFAADVVRVDIEDFPACPADRAESAVLLTDATGALVGHDEGPLGAVTGLSNDTLGNRFACEQRLADPQRRNSVFNTVPWVMYATDERIRNLMVRRIANSIEREAVSLGTSVEGQTLFYNLADPATPGSTPTLTEASRNAIHAVIYGGLSTDFATNIQNANDGDVDTGLVQVAPAVTVSGGNLLAVSVTIAPRVFGILLSLTITLAVQQ